MATTTFIPVEEYLRTTYRPDVDYLDGLLEERTLGEQFHAMVQAAIISILRNHRREWNVRPLPEQRVQVAETRYRVPDICLVPFDEPVVPILRRPPLLCIEVLSRRDSFMNIQARVKDFLAMGVPVVWIIDPMSREAWTATGEGIEMVKTAELVLAKTAVRLTFAEIFEDIDEAPIGEMPLDIVETLKPGETPD